MNSVFLTLAIALFFSSEWSGNTATSENILNYELKWKSLNEIWEPACSRVSLWGISCQAFHKCILSWLFFRLRADAFWPVVPGPPAELPVSGLRWSFDKESLMWRKPQYKRVENTLDECRGVTWRRTLTRILFSKTTRETKTIEEWPR